MSAPIVIPAGEERAELYAALELFRRTSQDWRPRDAATAHGRAVAAFDAMRARLANAQPVSSLPPELVDRLRSVLTHAEGKRFLAAAVDVPDLRALIASIDEQPTEGCVP